MLIIFRLVSGFSLVDLFVFTIVTRRMMRKEKEEQFLHYQTLQYISITVNSYGILLTMVELSLVVTFYTLKLSSQCLRKTRQPSP